MIMQPFPAKTRKRVKFMSYTKIAAIYADSEALSGQTVTVGGWVRTIRDMKTFGFIELNDGSPLRWRTIKISPPLTWSPHLLSPAPSS